MQKQKDYKNKNEWNSKSGYSQVQGWINKKKCRNNAKVNKSPKLTECILCWPATPEHGEFPGQCFGEN